jgi:hypothetical protein
MTNTFAPFGLRHIGYADGSSPTFGYFTAKILKTNTTKIFYGDPLVDAAGFVAQWTNASSAVNFRGVFYGCKYFSISQGKTVWSPFWPGNSDALADADAFIVPPQNRPRFLIQAGPSSSTNPITIASVGKNVDVNGMASAPGGQTFGGFLSGAFAVQTGTGAPAATATFPFQIVDLWPTPGYPAVANGSDATTAFNYIVVEPNWAAVSGVTV